MESASVAPQAITYSLTPGELSSDSMISGHISQGSNSRSPIDVSYFATIVASLQPHRCATKQAQRTRSSQAKV